MHTQPKHCCCCFNFKTGTLILASLGLIWNIFAAAALVAASALLEYSTLVVHVLAGFHIVFALLDVWFIVGAAKGNYSAVRAFSIFILVQVVFFTISQLLRIIEGIAKYKALCTPPSASGTCKYQPASLLVSALFSMFFSYLINVSCIFY
ncbi:hypothetical protein DSO57_1023038 [Entomophthora muscae]|uniref:Uncharacterized protein n=1 Tax=Entomophthora muscae TaxID=34485 RepID=A0ACC2UNX2_9FUNG|nr:hypothetical protein DSO57_1023038 [Entomophthora muscae]